MVFRGYIFTLLLAMGAADAVARAPASVKEGARSFQCKALSCHCGVCDRCASQAERLDCEKKRGEELTSESKENGTYYLNDDGALVSEDRDD